MKVKSIFALGLVSLISAACVANTPQNPNANPNAPAENLVKLTNMDSIKCDQEGTVKDKSGEASIMGLKNNALKPIKVYTLDGEGKRVMLVTLNEAQAHTFTGHVNQPLLIANAADDKCLGIYTANSTVNVTLAQTSF